MPVVVEKQTLYSITLNGLTEHQLLEIMKVKEAGQMTLKAIKQEIARMVNEPTKELVASTRARPLINESGKAECPLCGLGFEPRGLCVHMHGRHGIEEPRKWLEERGFVWMKQGPVARAPAALLRADNRRKDKGDGNVVEGALQEAD